MLRRMICLGLFFLCGCYHTLELVNLDYYAVGKRNRIPERKGQIFVGFETATVSSKRFEEEFIKALKKRTNEKVEKDTSAIKGVDDLTLSLTIRELLDGKTSNFAISWPGFIIFTPAWYGYGYVAQYKVNVDVYIGNSPMSVMSLFIPINLEMRHADIGRTWAATGCGWISGLFAIVNGFYCTTYDEDITDDFYDQAFETIAEYAVNEVVRELKKFDFAMVSGGQNVVIQDKPKEVKRIDEREEDERAQNKLEMCLEQEEGEVIFDEAVRSVRTAALEGDVGAQFELGGYYYAGQGVEKSYKKAVIWWRKAAEEGSAQAQYNLGVCYRKGQGVKKSDVEAIKWYRKAAEQGHENAKKALARLTK